MGRRTWTAAVPSLLLGALLLLAPAAAPAFAPVSWSGPLGTAPNKDIEPPDLSAEIRAGLALTTWPDFGDVTRTGAPEWFRDECLNVGAGNAASCVYGPTRATRVVALIGDSVAASWLPGLRRAAAREGYRIHVLTRSQCPAAAIPGGTTAAVTVSCAEHQRWAVNEAIRLKPELVVLSSRYRSATPGQWFSGIATTLHRLAPARAPRTVILAPPPDTGIIASCLQLRLPPAGCTRSVTSTYRLFLDHERKAAQLYGARFVDTRSWSCLQQVCPAVVDGRPVHHDGKHLSAAFSELLWRHLEDALEP